MAADSQWQVKLQTIIDTSNISAQLKSLASQTLKVDAKLDLSNFTSGMNTMKSMAQEVNNEMQRILSGQGINVDNKITSGWANEYVKSWEKANQQVQQDINRTLESLNNFSFKNAGFENFSTTINTELGKAEVSVQELQGKLTQLKFDGGDISGLSNMKNEIDQLEQKFTQLSQQANQAFQSLNNYSLSHAGFDDFQVKINGSIQSVETLKSELSQMSVNANFAGLDEITAKISQIKAEFEQVSQIQFNMELGTYEAQVDSLVAKSEQWNDTNGKLAQSTSQLQSAMQELAAASKAYSENSSYENQQRLIQAQEQLQQATIRTKNAVTEYNAEWAKTSQVQSLLQRITEFVDKNSAAMRNFGGQLNSMMAELNSGVQMPVSRLKELETQFKQVGNAAREAGQLGQSFGDKIQSAMSKFSYWTSATMIVMQSINAIRSAITTVVDLDTALIDLQKTTSMTTDELEDFYYAANDTAKQMGVTTEEIINQAAAWSRLGYSSQEAATTMAALSSQFASISPGMDTETAQEGLVSVMKANIQMPLYTEMCA